MASIRFEFVLSVSCVKEAGLKSRLFCCTEALADQDRSFVIADRKSSMAKGLPMTKSTGLSESLSFSR